MPHIGRPTLYQPEFCEKLIKHMSKGLSFESFAAECGVCFDTLYEWVKVHPSFSEAKKEGLAQSMKWWEALLALAASGERKNANMTGIIFALKNKFPAVYRDKINIEGNVEIKNTALETISESEKTKILQAALEAKLKKIQSENNESDGE